MSLNPETVKTLIDPLMTITPIDTGVSVTTHCLYPSNSAVSVSVRMNLDSFVVSDDGEAVREAESSGLRLDEIDRKIKRIVKHQGLLVKKGVIFSPRVQLEAIPAAILLVANASKDAAGWLLDNSAFGMPRNFKKDVADLLNRYFHSNIKHDETIIGQSNKPHRFGHVIYLSEQRKALIDPVTNDPASINARVIANLDVKMLHDDKIIQRVIYDDLVDWSAADINLLEIGATPIPFSRAAKEIERLAA